MALLGGIREFVSCYAADHYHILVGVDGPCTRDRVCKGCHGIAYPATDVSSCPVSVSSLYMFHDTSMFHTSLLVWSVGISELVHAQDETLHVSFMLGKLDPQCYAVHQACSRCTDCKIRQTLRFVLLPCGYFSAESGLPLLCTVVRLLYPAYAVFSLVVLHLLPSIPFPMATLSCVIL